MTWSKLVEYIRGGPVPPAPEHGVDIPEPSVQVAKITIVLKSTIVMSVNVTCEMGFPVKELAHQHMKERWIQVPGTEVDRNSKVPWSFINADLIQYYFVEEVDPKVLLTSTNS